MSAVNHELPRQTRQVRGSGYYKLEEEPLSNIGILSSVRALLIASVLFLCSFGASASVYEIGPGKKYTTLAAAPWNTLGPGDVVNIYWQAQPYREKLLLSCRGSAQAPIQINGIPNAGGQRPVLDGQGATTDSQFVFPYAPTQDRGLVILSIGGHAWGYKPGYITIQGLELRNASVPNTYKDAQGVARTYQLNAAAIFVERGEHIAVRNCDIHDSGNGFFVASGGSEEVLSRDILLESCYVHDNGNVGRDREHNIYTEAIGTVFQFNRLGRLRAGAGGNNLKDRSAGTVVRYNWIEGGAHLLDLVEPEESAKFTCADQSYHRTFVYGNVMIDGPVGGAGFLVHYGGDNGNLPTYRKGTLYFYHNTVLNQANQTGAGARWRTILLQLETNDESADVRNNIVCTQPATLGQAPTELSLLNTVGKTTFGVNWVSSGWLVGRSGMTFQGSVSGLDNLLSSANNSPGFANSSVGDFHLVFGSASIGVGGKLTAEQQGPFGVYFQFLSPVGGTLRLGNRLGPDLGAFGYGIPVPIPTYKISGKVTNRGVGVGDVAIQANNGASARTATDGTYTLPGLQPAFYVVSAAKDSYVLSAGQLVTLGADMAEVDFTATRMYSVSGKVTCQGQGLAGVTVIISNGTSTITAIDGGYALKGLSPGTYSISVTEAGYTFGPAQSIVVGTDQANVNFAGYSNDTPVQIASFTLNVNRVNSYERPKATIVLNRPVPSGYITIRMSTTNASVVQVTDVLIWGGMDQKSFDISTTGVTQNTDVTISANLNGATQSVKLTVVP